MSNRLEKKSFAPQAEQLRQRRDNWLRIFDAYLREKMSERDGFQSDLPLTAHFLIDGSAKIPFSEFSKLPKWMKTFFLDDRISRPPSVTVFSDYQDSIENPRALASIQNNTQSIALRGGRYWDFDGSKANFGPNGAEAVELLFENISGDINIIEQLLRFEPQNEYEWLAKISAWEFIRNDLCAIYYSLKCRMAKIDNTSAHELSLAGKALEYVSNRYFDSILMFETDTNSGLEELKEVFFNKEELQKTLTEFVADPQFEDRDLLRSHREVNNPLALLNAFRLIYKLDETTGKLRYTDEMILADAVVSPLYGGIDLIYAFKYALENGHAYLETLFNTNLQDAQKNIPVLPILSKIGSKGVVRSQLTKPDGTIAHLSTDEAVNGREKSWLADEIPNAKNILVIDDSLATGGSAKVFNEWLVSALGHELNIIFRVIYANLRWSEYQCPVDTLMESDPISQSPISRNMKKSIYSYGSRFMPDAVASYLQQRTKRTVLDLSEATPILVDLYQKNIIQSVGLDLDDTLVLRTVDSKERRARINTSILELLQENGIEIEPNEYAQRSYQVLNAERKKSHLDPDYPIDTTSCNKAILLEFGITDPQEIENLAEMMTNVELKVDREIIIPAPGARTLLEELTNMGINFGIFSNSHYTSEHLFQILTAAGLDDLFENRVIMTSSQQGIAQKPNAPALKKFAEALQTFVQDLAYVGNSFDSDVVGAMKSGAVGIYIPQPINDISKSEIKKIQHWRDQLENVQNSSCR